jgi:two-component system NtrC family sensor kinase
MTSVRLRLLVMALTPLAVLMPLLLFLGMTRWSADYDRVLIANVESDLRIAEQYLARIMTDTGADLQAVAVALDFAMVLPGGAAALERYLADKRQELELDFLYYLPRDATWKGADRWPVVVSALNGEARSEIDIFASADLQALDPALAERARIPLIETEAAVPTDRSAEDRGMVVHAAAPVGLAGYEGVLVGGILLNRNLQFIDTINALVYLNAVTGGDRQGTATLFLDDVRVSTNVRLFEDVRALGTRVSAVVRGAVLGQGRTWLDRAFVVNDWYISGYLPLSDSYGSRVGMLYVGFLEAPFSAAKEAAVLSMMAAFFGVTLVSAPLFLWLAKGIFAPLERMTATMRKVELGDLGARNGDLGARGEIGAVASHLDSLLDQVQDRDARLRAYAEDLNQRVEERTSELRDANARLELTYQQLVMSEKLASIGQITAGVAHEINNPVAVIQGNVDVMREVLAARAKDVETELGLIDRQVGRITAIVGKLLQFARPGDFSGHGDVVALAPIVGDCLVLVGHLMARREIEVVRDFAEAPPVRIDPGEMQQVAVNLIVNAVQAMGDRGRLTLQILAQAHEGVAGTALSVRDTGPGIPADRLSSVFDPFFTTKQAEGTGLGLSISQTLIRQAGGVILAGNPEGGGAEFRVWLPAAAVQDPV